MGSKIVIVGGGPIGCWTALQAKKRNSSLDTICYERFRDYRRDHIMTIQRRSIIRWCAKDAANDSFLKRLFGAQATCSELCGTRADSGNSQKASLPRLLDIRTIDFERIVKEECEAVGVRFIYRKIESPEILMDEHQDCAHFIAADGANSRMRAAIWGRIVSIGMTFFRRWISSTRRKVSRGTC
jgi:2-polyprenyl-6-methoxyphenol hydroxylase-like FAD-dependent oxidoreductase